MITQIFIIATGGRLCYFKSLLGTDEIDKDIVSGFLSAFKDLAEEMTAGEINSFNFRNFNLIHDYDVDLDLMFVIVIDIDDLEKDARDRMVLLKQEFIKRYREHLINWSGSISIFRPFDEFIEDHIFIPPKLLITGLDGVGKSTIMNLFPGETVLRLDEDLNEVIEKPINVKGLEGLKQFILRQINLEELVDNSKLYRNLLNSVDVVCIVTKSTASNLGKTKEFFQRLKKLLKKADIYVIANFQDLKDQAFEPEKIEESFGVKTFPFSAIALFARDKIFIILFEILRMSISDTSKYFKALKGLQRKK